MIDKDTMLDATEMSITLSACRQQIHTVTVSNAGTLHNEQELSSIIDALQRVLDSSRCKRTSG